MDINKFESLVQRLEVAVSALEGSKKQETQIMRVQTELE
jgi:hypothetical protein